MNLHNLMSKTAIELRETKQPNALTWGELIFEQRQCNDQIKENKEATRMYISCMLSPIDHS